MSFGMVAASYFSVAPSVGNPLAIWNFENINMLDDTCADVTGNGFILSRGMFGTWAAGHNSSYAAQGDPNGAQSDLGAGAYGIFPGGSPGGNALTICCWVRVPNVTNGAPLVCALNSSGRVDPMGLGVEPDGSVQMYWYSDADAMSGAPVSVTPAVVANDTWAHVAVVLIPGSGATLYANGVVVTTYGWQSGSSAFYSTWETLLLGSSRWGSSDGIVDDLRIYHEALTGPQITILMNQPA